MSGSSYTSVLVGVIFTSNSQMMVREQTEHTNLHLAFDPSEADISNLECSLVSVYWISIEISPSIRRMARDNSLS